MLLSAFWRFMEEIPQHQGVGQKVRCFLCHQVLALGTNGSIKSTVERHLMGSGGHCSALTKYALKLFDELVEEEYKSKTKISIDDGNGKRKAVDPPVSAGGKLARMSWALQDQTGSGDRGANHLDDIQNNVFDAISMISNLSRLIIPDSKSSDLVLQVVGSHTEKMEQINKSATCLAQECQKTREALVASQEQAALNNQVLVAQENGNQTVLSQLAQMRGDQANVHQALDTQQVNMQNALSNQLAQILNEQQNLHQALFNLQAQNLMLQQQLAVHNQEQHQQFPNQLYAAQLPVPAFGLQDLGMGQVQFPNHYAQQLPVPAFGHQDLGMGQMPQVIQGQLALNGHGIGGAFGLLDNAFGDLNALDGFAGAGAEPIQMEGFFQGVLNGLGNINAMEDIPGNMGEIDGNEIGGAQFGPGDGGNQVFPLAIGNGGMEEQEPQLPGIGIGVQQNMNADDHALPVGLLADEMGVQAAESWAIGDPPAQGNWPGDDPMAPLNWINDDMAESVSSRTWN